MRLQDVEVALREIVGALEPEALSADAAVGLVDTFVTLEKLVAAGKALAARRVAASNLWRGAGERSAAHWLARRSGVSIGNAMATLETAARLPELPGVDRAVRAGELSAVQANEIASAAGDGTGAGSSPPRNTVHVVIDHAALVRGKAEPGERCEVAGVGPVPVNVVRSMMDDAFVTAVVTNGVDVATVAHLGRRPTAHQRSA